MAGWVVSNGMMIMRHCQHHHPFSLSLLAGSVLISVKAAVAVIVGWRSFGIAMEPSMFFLVQSRWRVLAMAVLFLEMPAANVVPCKPRASTRRVLLVGGGLLDALGLEQAGLNCVVSGLWWCLKLSKRSSHLLCRVF
jgi:hypothetical protein